MAAAAPARSPISRSQDLRSRMQAALPRLALPLTLAPQPAPELLPTGIAAIDRPTGGGVPRGSMTEIAWEASSGRTTLLLSLLARATRLGEYCALIDGHDTFDPFTAAQSGADLSRLLWVRCGGNAEHALKAADRIVQAGGFGLIALDLADADLLTARRFRWHPGSGCGTRWRKRRLRWWCCRASSTGVPAPACNWRWSTDACRQPVSKAVDTVHH